MRHDETPDQALRSIQAARRADDQKILTVGMARIAVALVAGTCPDPRAALETAAFAARNRAANDYQGDRLRWCAIADLLETSAADTAVVTLAKLQRVMTRAG